MADELAPTGTGLYDLPAAQSVRVDFGENTVTVVAKVLVSGRPAPVSIGMPMTAAVADDLLSQLPTAIGLARKGGPKAD